MSIHGIEFCYPDKGTITFPFKELKEALSFSHVLRDKYKYKKNVLCLKLENEFIEIQTLEKSNIHKNKDK